MIKIVKVLEKAEVAIAKRLSLRINWTSRLVIKRKFCKVGARKNVPLLFNFLTISGFALLWSLFFFALLFFFSQRTFFTSWKLFSRLGAAYFTIVQLNVFLLNPMLVCLFIFLLIYLSYILSLFYVTFYFALHYILFHFALYLSHFISFISQYLF